MKIRKISFWIVICLGIFGIIASISLFMKGADFSTYFLSGFSGLALIITMLLEKKKQDNSVS
ncbi:MAG: hypothetical protein PHQ74_09510 [Crocinitomicaceae bacterium]|nr:hypothetical protein [Crocinitomicaceae bacterium]